jgi:hypothetical protein
MRPLVSNVVRRPGVEASVVELRARQAAGVRPASFVRALLAPLLAAGADVLRAFQDSRAREADRIMRRYAHLIHEAEARNAREDARAVSPSRADADAAHPSFRGRRTIGDGAVARHS